MMEETKCLLEGTASGECDHMRGEAEQAIWLYITTTTTTTNHYHLQFHDGYALSHVHPISCQPTGIEVTPLKDILKALRVTNATIALRSLQSSKKAFMAAHLQPLVTMCMVRLFVGGSRW